MSWFRRMLLQARRPDTPGAIGPEDRAALDRAKEQHERILNCADQAIHDAMAHADEVFGPAYKGPDRRHHPR